MDKNSAFGELMEKGQQTVSDTTKKAVSDVADSVAGQLGIKNGTNSNNSQNPQPQVSSPKPGDISQNVSESMAADETAEEMVRDLYAPSESFPSAPSSEEQERMETAQKLVALRKQLHDEIYYNPLVSPQKPEEEERPAERVERQEKEEMQDLQEKDASKPPPLAVQRAQTTIEINRGVAG